MKLLMRALRLTIGAKLIYWAMCVLDGEDTQIAISLNYAALGVLAEIEGIRRGD